MHEDILWCKIIFFVNINKITMHEDVQNHLQFMKTYYGARFIFFW